jgi:hypothetical protein
MIQDGQESGWIAKTIDTDPTATLAHRCLATFWRR